jgi:hypothetical protein
MELCFNAYGPQVNHTDITGNTSSGRRFHRYGEEDDVTAVGPNWVEYKSTSMTAWYNDDGGYDITREGALVRCQMAEEKLSCSGDTASLYVGGLSSHAPWTATLDREQAR